MKTLKTTRLYLFLIVPLLLVSFTTGDSKSQYSIPMAAWSVTAGDIDMDGDNDIVVGHNYNSQTQWSGVSFILNNGDGTFILNDSIFLYSWQTHIYTVNTDNDSFPEIIARHYENETQYMAVLNFEQGNYVTNLYDMTYGISGNNIGDINGDYCKDIVLYSNDNQFWGVMYNDGTGNFSNPEYHYVSDYFPTELACGDLNGDNRDDIVVCGQSTEVYFSYPDGFQSLVLETDNFKEGASIVDFDLDGDNDILTFVGIPVVNVTTLIMYKNQGNNIFDVFLLLILIMTVYRIYYFSCLINQVILFIITRGIFNLRIHNLWPCHLQTHRKAGATAIVLIWMVTAIMMLLR